jgi:hypothetical protein
MLHEPVLTDLGWSWLEWGGGGWDGVINHGRAGRQEGKPSAQDARVAKE